MEQTLLIILLALILVTMVAIIALWVIALIKNGRARKGYMTEVKISIDNHSDSTPDEDIIKSKENGFKPKNC